MKPEDLAALARGAAENAYVPYSTFRVGAVVVGAGGEMFLGANVENASYPVSSCAEATAVSTAVAAGIRKIDTVAVACIDATEPESTYPCGRCRQIMSEFDVETVIVTGPEGSEIRTHTLDELLPHRFKL